MRNNAQPITEKLSSLLGHVDHNAAHIVAAFWTDDVSWHASAAVRTISGLLFLDIVVRTSFARTRIRMLSLGYGHVSRSSKCSLNWFFCAVAAAWELGIARPIALPSSKECSKIGTKRSTVNPK